MNLKMWTLETPGMLGRNIGDLVAAVGLAASLTEECSRSGGP